MLNQLLEGKNAESQKRLDELFKSIGDNPKICWYPSSGDDYRDVLELTKIDEIKLTDIGNKSINIAMDYKMTELPDIFIHSDYSKEISAALKKKKILYNDKKTKVVKEKLSELKFKNNLSINYYVNPVFVFFPKYALKSPEIYLLNLKIISDRLGEIKRPVLYFSFENINFLQEVLLKHRIEISHFVKVKDRVMHSGKSIALVYAFLSVLKTKYLVVDNNCDIDCEQVKEIASHEGLELKNYELKELKPTRQITTPIKWSGHPVNVLKVVVKNSSLTESELERLSERGFSNKQ